MDLQLERFCTELLRDGLLENTVVLILGDHGRHEGIGATDEERWVGHHTIPLFIWMDESLRAPATYRPRTVSTVASQVDLAPTILGLAGLLPRVSPFMGRDFSCLVGSDCLKDNVALLSSNDRIALAEGDRLLLYSLKTETLRAIHLDLQEPAITHQGTEPQVAAGLRRLKALFVSSNLLLEQNRIWSWKELGPAL